MAGMTPLGAKIDSTPAGQQYVLPGAERATPAQIARRRAAEPLRASKPQQPCDHGLFSDDARQTDLIDAVRRHR